MNIQPMLNICKENFSKFPFCDKSCLYAHTERCEITKTDERLKEMEYSFELKKQIKKQKELGRKKASFKLFKKITEKYYKNKLSNRISALVRHSLKGNKNGSHWEDLVGYNLQDLIIHLESLFRDNMTWQNMGKWHIDHRKPVSSFNFTSYEDKEFKECWSLINLQPLWALENIRKSNRII